MICLLSFILLQIHFWETYKNQHHSQEWLSFKFGFASRAASLTSFSSSVPLRVDTSKRTPATQEAATMRSTVTGAMEGLVDLSDYCSKSLTTWGQEDSEEALGGSLALQRRLYSLFLLPSASWHRTLSMASQPQNGLPQETQQSLASSKKLRCRLEVAKIPTMSYMKLIHIEAPD